MKGSCQPRTRSRALASGGRQLHKVTNICTEPSINHPLQINSGLDTEVPNVTHESFPPSGRKCRNYKQLSQHNKQPSVFLWFGHLRVPRGTQSQNLQNAAVCRTDGAVGRADSQKHQSKLLENFKTLPYIYTVALEERWPLKKVEVTSSPLQNCPKSSG